MSDISNVLRKVIELDISLGLDGTQEALDEITRLTAEVEKLKKEITGRQAHDRMQVREIKHLTADNEKLRAALNSIAANTYGYEPDVMSDEEAKNYFAGLFFDAQNKARAALSGDRHE
jgi:regulator of replication initiation timing